MGLTALSLTGVAGYPPRPEDGNAGQDRFVGWDDLIADLVIAVQTNVIADFPRRGTFAAVEFFDDADSPN